MRGGSSRVSLRSTPGYKPSAIHAKLSALTGEDTMPELLAGRIALVTGAGSGIGEGIAHGMAKAGARVVAVDIDSAAAVRTARAIGGNAVHHTCDVTDRAACDALAA